MRIACFDAAAVRHYNRGLFCGCCLPSGISRVGVCRFRAKRSRAALDRDSHEDFSASRMRFSAMVRRRCHDKVLGRLAVEIARRCAASTSPSSRRTSNGRLHRRRQRCAHQGHRQQGRRQDLLPPHRLPGGIREQSFAKMQGGSGPCAREGRERHAAEGPLGYAMIKKLKVYGDATHPIRRRAKALEV